MKNNLLKILALLFLFSFTHFALASEVTGNLSTSVPGLLSVIPPASAPSGGSYFTATPSSAFLHKDDANNDGRIDVLDFAFLMANWGKTGSRIASDFNGDGKVDIFDFVLLMTHWTK